MSQAEDGPLVPGDAGSVGSSTTGFTRSVTEETEDRRDETGV